jgi:Putative zinc-finger
MINTSTGACPSLEEIGAFLQGRLSEERRARVESHIADCPDCYEVFAEAALFQKMEEEEASEPLPAPASQVIPFPERRFRSWKVPASIAAVLVIGLATGLLYQWYTRMPEMVSAQLVSPAVVEKAGEDRFWEQWSSRGHGSDSGSVSNVPALLLGAHLVDLGVHLARNDKERALDDLARISGTIQELGSVPGELVTSYLKLQAEIADQKQPRDFVRQAADAEAGLTREFPVEKSPYLAFGKWTEAGRLSALAGSPDFFVAPESRKFLRALLGKEREKLDKPVVKALDEIQQTLDAPEPSPLPYLQLRELFESILTHYQRKS